MAIQDYREDFILWDTICVGDDVPEKFQGFRTFGDMADSSTPYAFFSQRQESETGSFYTNMKKKTGIDWPFYVESIGIRWYYPDPINAGPFDGDRAAAKVFCEVVPQHSIIEFYVGGSDDKLLTLLPEYAPSGYGPTGDQTGVSVEYSSIISSGIASAANRWNWTQKALALPKDISIEVRLQLAKKAKDFLRALGTVNPIVFQNGSVHNWAMVRVSLRGMRDSQRKGAWYRTPPMTAEG